MFLKSPSKSAYMVGGRGVEVESLLETLLVQIPLAVNLLFWTIVSEFVRELFLVVSNIISCRGVGADHLFETLVVRIQSAVKILCCVIDFCLGSPTFLKWRWRHHVWLVPKG